MYVARVYPAEFAALREIALHEEDAPAGLSLEKYKDIFTLIALDSRVDPGIIQIIGTPFLREVKLEVIE